MQTPPAARRAWIRLATLALAFVHSFPARRHLGAFFEHPSLADGWEGFGALVAIGVYLLPPATQLRALRALWRRRKEWLRTAGFVLAAAHAVPALDHLPRLIEFHRWGDAWRGIGSALAVTWFLLPLPLQGRVVARLVRLGPSTPRNDARRGASGVTHRLRVRHDCAAG
jgi:hypothetical protein